MTHQRRAAIARVRTRQTILLTSGIALLAVGHFTAMPLGGIVELVALGVFALVVWWSDGAETGAHS